MVGTKITSTLGFGDYLIRGTIKRYCTPVISHKADAGLVHQHLVVATLNCPMQEHVPIGQGLFKESVEIREGWLYLPETPGASTDFLPEMFDKFRVA